MNCDACSRESVGASTAKMIWYQPKKSVALHVASAGTAKGTHAVATAASTSSRLAALLENVQHRQGGALVRQPSAVQH